MWEEYTALAEIHSVLIQRITGTYNLMKLRSTNRTAHERTGGVANHVLVGALGYATLGRDKKATKNQGEWDSSDSQLTRSGVDRLLHSQGVMLCGRHRAYASR